tara:strand:+ start:4502 stop:5389 length:888 start_codon:yes stop_codon:yes gene_type:complete
MLGDLEVKTSELFLSLSKMTEEREFPKSASLVYVDFSSGVDKNTFAGGSHIVESLPSFDLSLAKNPGELRQTIGELNKHNMPFVWFRGDLHDYTKLGDQFPVNSLNSCMVICEEPYDGSHATSKSNSPFFKGIMGQDHNQRECWTYFSNNVGCEMPSERSIESGSHQIRGIHAVHREETGILGVIQSAYSLHLEQQIDGANSQQQRRQRSGGRSATHYVAALWRVVAQGFPSLTVDSQESLVRKLRTDDLPHCAVFELGKNRYHLDIGAGIDEEEYNYIPKVKGFDGLYKRELKE